LFRNGALGWVSLTVLAADAARRAFAQRFGRLDEEDEYWTLRRVHASAVRARFRSRCACGQNQLIG